MKVTASQFNKYLDDEVMIRIHATASVKTTNQLVIIDQIINIDFPMVKFVDLPKSAVSSKPCTFTVTIENPLDQPLTECKMFLDGTIIKDRMEFKDLKYVVACLFVFSVVRILFHYLKGTIIICGSTSKYEFFYWFRRKYQALGLTVQVPHARPVPQDLGLCISLRTVV